MQRRAPRQQNNAINEQKAQKRRIPASYQYVFHHPPRNRTLAVSPLVRYSRRRVSTLMVRVLIPGNGGPEAPHITTPHTNQREAKTHMAVNLKPLGDRVVIKPPTKEEITKSGIVIPDTTKEKPQEGTIIAVGPGRTDEDGDRIPMDVKVGDKVLFAKYAGTEMKIEDEDFS